MSDNEESLKVDLDQDNFINEETNDFAKSLEEISKDDPPSSTNKISQTLNQTSTINHTISDLNGDIRRLDQQAEEMKKTTTRITFNCPYCKSFVSIDKDRIFSNICTCPNCRKDLIIKDGIVKVYK